MSEREATGETIFEKRREWLNGKVVDVARLSSPVGIWAVLIYMVFQLTAKLDEVVRLLNEIHRAVVK
ncbi:MAG: hypothetical protein ACRD2K_03815 [Terriglobales bacterium]